MLIALSAVVSINIFDSENSSAVPIEERAFSDRNTVVFSDDAFLSDLKDSLVDHTSKVDATSGFSSVETGDIVVIDESWIYQSNKQQVNAGIVETIQKHAPLVFVGESSYLFKESGIPFQSAGYSDDEVVYCLYKNADGVEFSLSVESEDVSSAVAIAYSWADVLSSSDDPYDDVRTFSWMRSEADSNDVAPDVEETRLSPLGSTPGTAYWGFLAFKSSVTTCGSYGAIAQTTEVYKLQDFNDPQYDYYSFHYYQYGEPVASNGYRIADMYLTGTYSSTITLIGHSPTSTSGSSSAGVSLGLGVSVNGPSGSASLSWSYSVSDVVLSNQSQLSTNVVNFWHDVNESKAVGSGYSTQPSTTVKVQKNASYLHCDVHSIQFCKEVTQYIGLLPPIPIGKTYVDFQSYNMNYIICISNDVVTGA
ncbi:MAG: hypothetical protein LBS92_00025 [Candidatus Methanoplasma sp.]|nr:hypothetical protein [Candidatus Methanoplasma sp.]